MPESTLPERVFYEIIEDLRDFLDILTLVGGWVPFVYARYLWRLPIPSIVTTADIDFGISDKSSLPLGRTVYETLSLLDYSERHVRLGRLQPVVFYRAGKIPVEFIADTRSDHKVMVRTLGPQIHINRIDGFAFLLEERISVRIELKTGALAVFCPKPAAFLYNKLGIFSSREDEFKRAKDLRG